MNQRYEKSRKYVGIDLHRRRCVVLRIDGEGDVLGCVKRTRIWSETDLRRLLPSIRTPALLLADQPSSDHVRVTDIG